MALSMMGLPDYSHENLGYKTIFEIHINNKLYFEVQIYDVETISC